MNDDFFVGYSGRVPARDGGLMRGVAAVFVVVVAVAAALVAFAQRPADIGTYEFGVVKSFEGVVALAPVPMLREVRGDDAEPRDLLLVGAMKSGAPERLASFDGRRVRLDGSLMYRGNQAMIEVLDPATITALDDAPAAVADATDLGTLTLRGELLDTKCYLGAMRPAVGKIHRACAAVCLKSGIPAGLRLVDGDGREAMVLLAGPPGQRLPIDPQLAGTMIEVSGPAERVGSFVVVRVASHRRL